MLKNRATVTSSLVILLCIAMGVFVASCQNLGPRGVVISPIAIPGAEYVGMDSCKMCHTKEAAQFRGAPHEAFTMREARDEQGNDILEGEGCESCHGPGSLHVAGGGDKSKIVRGDYRGCVSCHLDVKAKLNMRFRHPIAEGRVSCTDCHDPHNGIRPVFRVEAANNKCFKCHPDKRGPWTFPHEAVTEDGCSTCHDPHGSNLDKMLNATQPNLCLKCHYEAVNHPKIGRFSHSGGKYVIRGCNNCHRGMHGSNFSRTLRHE